MGKPSPDTGDPICPAIFDARGWVTPEFVAYAQTDMAHRDGKRRRLSREELEAIRNGTFEAKYGPTS